MTKAVALYFPQLHPIPENDRWWGKGFTDWVNVRRARPLFPGHHQPRVPLGGNYYDQSQEEVVRAQVALAKQFGLYGFCHYHYWFDGKQLLETPTERFLRARDLDFRFCLAWANETWSRRWDGQNHAILIEQTHPADQARWELHFRYLIRCWSDPRAITVDGKPIFLIYRPHLIARLGDMLDYFRERAHQSGLPGLYFVSMTQFETPPEPIQRHFDALMLFQPQVSMFALRTRKKPAWRKAAWHLRVRMPARLGDRFQFAADWLAGPTVEDYDAVWQEIVSRTPEPGITTLLGAFVDWDNTARYGRRATLFAGALPDRFEFWMRRLVGAASANREPEQLIFVNAWNEWAEGAHLEPDEKYGHLYLHGLRRALGAPAVEQPREGEGSDLAVAGRSR